VWRLPDFSPASRRFDFAYCDGVSSDCV
jgi:hypothetical protein